MNLKVMVDVKVMRGTLLMTMTKNMWREGEGGGEGGGGGGWW